MILECTKNYIFTNDIFLWK